MFFFSIFLLFSNEGYAFCVVQDYCVQTKKKRLGLIRNDKKFDERTPIIFANYFGLIFLVFYLFFNFFLLFFSYCLLFLCFLIKHGKMINSLRNTLKLLIGVNDKKK